MPSETAVGFLSWRPNNRVLLPNKPPNIAPRLKSAASGTKTMLNMVKMPRAPKTHANMPSLTPAFRRLHPQCGQALAAVLICAPHSRQGLRAVFPSRQLRRGFIVDFVQGREVQHKLGPLWLATFRALHL
jgi:hypothetical protein